MRVLALANFAVLGMALKLNIYGLSIVPSISTRWQHLRRGKSSSTLCDSKRDFSGQSWSSISKPTINSDANEKVKLLKSLQQKKKRDALDLLLLEGHRQVIDAINDGFQPKLLLYSDKCLVAPLGAALRDSLKKCSEDSVFCAAENVVQGISDTVTAQGVIGAFQKPKKQTQLPQSSSSSLVVLLDRPADPGNVGTIIRTSYGLGVDAIIIADGCDPWSPKVLRSAMGACLKIPIIEARWSEVAGILSGTSVSNAPYIGTDSSSTNKIQVLLADADETAVPYYEADYTMPTVIIIGSEADGIGNDALALPNSRKVIIPMARPLESFNAAVACSIILGEATRQRK